MKLSTIITGIIICSFVFQSCESNPYENYKTLKTYEYVSNPCTYTIHLKEGNVFDRTDLIAFTKNIYWGKYSIVKDSIYLQYDNEMPENELDYGKIANDELLVKSTLNLFKTMEYKKDVKNIDPRLIGKKDTFHIEFNLLK